MICSKFITFAVTKTTEPLMLPFGYMLWFAQNSLPLRWQRQHPTQWKHAKAVVICSKFITFAVTKTTKACNRTWSSWLWFAQNSLPLRWQRQRHKLRHFSSIRCDLLKIHYLCGDKDNYQANACATNKLWFAQNSLPLRWQRQRVRHVFTLRDGCDLLKIHYLCGDKDNMLTALFK